MTNLGLIFGGMSTENEISLKSGISILNNLDKERYNIFPIYIDKEGDWYEYYINKKIENIATYLKNMDIIFPVLHGLYGEDGTIQGMLEILKVPYVGCGTLASSIGMDKAYAKIIFEKADIMQAKYLYIKKYKDNKFLYINDNLSETKVDMIELINLTKEKIKYPVFVKPSNSGSSVGVNKAETDQQLIDCINKAFRYDNKILIEEAIIGKEVECAVIGNSEIGVEVSRVGQILSAEEFYTFDAKYVNKASRTVIPAEITEEQSDTIRKMAVKAFKAIDGNGLSRVDFFVEDNTNKVYISEINTMPGFTDISMYPKLMEDLGYSYKELLNKLIQMSLK